MDWRKGEVIVQVLSRSRILQVACGVTFCPIFSRTPTSQRTFFIEHVSSFKKENLFDYEPYTSKSGKVNFTGMKQCKGFLWELIRVG